MRVWSWVHGDLTFSDKFENVEEARESAYAGEWGSVIGTTEETRERLQSSLAEMKARRDFLWNHADDGQGFTWQTLKEGIPLMEHWLKKFEEMASQSEES